MPRAEVRFRDDSINAPRNGQERSPDRAPKETELLAGAHRLLLAVVSEVSFDNETGGGIDVGGESPWSRRWRDVREEWPTYLVLSMLLALFCMIPFVAYRGYQNGKRRAAACDALETERAQRLAALPKDMSSADQIRLREWLRDVDAQCHPDRVERQTDTTIVPIIISR